MTSSIVAAKKGLRKHFADVAEDTDLKTDCKLILKFEIRTFENFSPCAHLFFFDKLSKDQEIVQMIVYEYQVFERSKSGEQHSFLRPVFPTISESLF